MLEPTIECSSIARMKIVPAKKKKNKNEDSSSENQARTLRKWDSFSLSPSLSLLMITCFPRFLVYFGYPCHRVLSGILFPK